MRICVRILKFLKLPLHKKAVLFETFFMLGVGRITALLSPMSGIKESVERGTSRCLMENPDADGGSESVNGAGYLGQIELIKWSVGVMSRYTPWKSNCFAQALAAHRMLIRRGIPSTMYFGLAREAGGKIAAHAWLMYKDTVITGAYRRKRYSTVMQMGYGQNKL